MSLQNVHTDTMSPKTKQQTIAIWKLADKCKMCNLWSYVSYYFYENDGPYCTKCLEDMVEGTPEERWNKRMTESFLKHEKKVIPAEKTWEDTVDLTNLFE